MCSLETRQKEFTLVNPYYRCHSTERFGPTFSPSPPSFGPWNLSAYSNLAKIVILYCHLTCGSPVPGHSQHMAGWEPDSQQCHSVPGANPHTEHRCSLGTMAEYFGLRWIQPWTLHVPTKTAQKYKIPPHALQWRGFHQSEHSHPTINSNFPKIRWNWQALGREWEHC